MANIEKTEAELKRISIAGELDEATFNASVREAVANSFKAQAEHRLFDSKVYLTDAQTNAIYNEIVRSLTNIFTTVISGVSNMTSAGIDRKVYNYRTDF